MDRRQQKTRQSIFDAFSVLLETKQYNQITIQEIIDQANIGRSTFYAHFETKDELLNTMCKDIFDHVFSATPEVEQTHDFSKNPDSLVAIIEHILFHIWDKRDDIRRILKSQSNSVFIGYLEQYLNDTFLRYKKNIRKDIPVEYAVYMLCGGFADTVKWWMSEKHEYRPDEVAAYYMKYINNVFVHLN
ncbi:MAG: TetR/AcrR family transcriptional regulator [bacterium]|nr:TetR/AcrR family transcriptional regulator [bacterium]